MEWPLLNVSDYDELRELVPFLQLFKELTLHFSSTKECRMSDCCLDFEDILVVIKVEYLDKKNVISDNLWYAANAAYTKLTKYYTKINSSSFAIATVLDPRYKLDVYETTQDPVALKESATKAIQIAFQQYELMYGQPKTQSVAPPPTKILKRFANHDQRVQRCELTAYLQEPRLTSEDDPLYYWRVNNKRFPILATMARDYLAQQPTSKDAEGTFSKGRRTVPYWRRSQTILTLQFGRV